MRNFYFISSISATILAVIAGMSFFFVACGSAGSVSAYKYDNGDDYFSDGLQRIVDKDGRIGFRDSVGKIVIAPQYAFAFPFKDGYAKVTDSGHQEAVDKRGEYHRWVSDSWYYIDTDGTKHPELIEIRGIVKFSDNDDLLKGAFIINNRTGKIALSDSHGQFKMLCENGDSLTISYVALITQTIPVNSKDSTTWMVSMPDYGPIIEPALQKSYSTNDKLKMVVVNPDALKMPVDSIVVEMMNDADEEATFGEYYEIEKETDGVWKRLPYNERIRKLLKNDGVEMVFNDVGYPIRPHSTRVYSNPTKAYNETMTPGRYRLSKKFSYPPYPTLKSDTAYVEFEIPTTR